MPPVGHIEAPSLVGELLNGQPLIGEMGIAHGSLTGVGVARKESNRRGRLAGPPEGIAVDRATVLVEDR
jgi:hypothetical protein